MPGHILGEEGEGKHNSSQPTSNNLLKTSHYTHYILFHHTHTHPLTSHTHLHYSLWLLTTHTHPPHTCTHIHLHCRLWPLTTHTHTCTYTHTSTSTPTHTHIHTVQKAYGPARAFKLHHFVQRRIRPTWEIYGNLGLPIPRVPRLHQRNIDIKRRAHTPPLQLDLSLYTPTHPHMCTYIPPLQPMTSLHPPTHTHHTHTHSPPHTSTTAVWPE